MPHGKGLTVRANGEISDALYLGGRCRGARTTLVEVLVLGELREVAAVLVLDVLLVRGVLGLDAVDPEGAHGDCAQRVSGAACRSGSRRTYWLGERRRG